MNNFQSLGLSESLMRALERMQFLTPTPIQLQAIPPALQGKDILGSAQTGTGKTAAFGIPLVEKLFHNSQSAAIVMTPTRELAVQVMDMLSKLSSSGKGGHHIKSALLIGGSPMQKQLQQLRRNPRLIVGTPGRINDHLDRRSLKLNNTDYLVLDETDRMLDIGFTEQIERVLTHMPEHRQTLLFSATLPKNIITMSKKYLKNPVRVSVDSISMPATKIKQEELRVGDGEKYKELLLELQKREGSVIIFVKTKRSADKMAIRLRDARHSVEAIHGDLRQTKRDRVLKGFRDKKNRILVATDVAARGLDIPHIEHVINYDLPQVAEDFIHRIGRTARAGAEGNALSFITPSDGKKWTAIRRLLNPNEKSSSEQRSNARNRKTVRPFRGKKSGDGEGKNRRRRNGGEEKSKTRFSEGGGYKTRSNSGAKSRSEEGNKSRSSEGSRYKPRSSEGGKFRSSEGENKPRVRKNSDKSRSAEGNSNASGEGRSSNFKRSSKPSGGRPNNNDGRSPMSRKPKVNGNKSGGGKSTFSKNRSGQSRPAKTGGQKRFNKPSN